MDLEELQKIAAKHPTGLVPVQWNIDQMPYQRGTVCGLPPDQALGHITLGNVSLYKAKKADAENLMLGMTGPEPGSHTAAEVPGGFVHPRVTPYDLRPEVTPRAQTAPGTPAAPAAPLPEANVPEDWEGFSASQKRQLAANLSGRTYQELSVEASETIIRAAVAGEPATAGPLDADQPGDMQRGVDAE